MKINFDICRMPQKSSSLPICASEEAQGLDGELDIVKSELIFAAHAHKMKTESLLVPK